MANREFEDLLESDDELPCVYDEIPELPAYQNDNRFDAIDFPWIGSKTFLEQCLYNEEVSSQSSSAIEPLPQAVSTSTKALLALKKEKITEKGIPSSAIAHLPQIVSSANAKTNEENEKCTDSKLIKKGILNKRDIFCVRCVATYSTDTTLLWFINFLMLKDMQSNYNFLKSCLVKDVINEKFSPKDEAYIDLKSHKFEIIVSNHFITDKTSNTYEYKKM